MSQRPVKTIWTNDFARSVDEGCITKLGIPQDSIIERAGLVIAERVRDFSTKQNRSVLVLAGTGNNGADGLAAARNLHEWGCDVRVVLVHDAAQDKRRTLSNRTQLQILGRMQVKIENYSFNLIQRQFAHLDTIVIDAVLGLGFKGTLRDGPTKDALMECAQLKSRRVIAVDLPSGMAADGGDSVPPLVADLTVTFGEAKICHLIDPHRNKCGEICVEDVGFARSIVSETEQSHPAEIQLAFEESTWRQSNPLSNLPRDTHKFKRGHVLIIGGSDGKMGAPLLAALSALRCGAGWVTVARNAGTDQTLEKLHPELTWEDLSVADFSAIASFCERRQVRSIVIGPGWVKQELDDRAMQSIQALMNQGMKFIFDAGATHGLESLLSSRPFTGDHAIATPHPGEWMKMKAHAFPDRINGLAEIQQSRQAAKSAGISVIYKSSTPILFHASGVAPIVVPFTDQRIAKAGSGDVLAGCLGALSIHCEDWPSTVGIGFAQMAFATRIASIQFGDRGLTAADLVAALGF